MTNEKILEKILTEIKINKEPDLKTGFKELDYILSGVELGSIITIAARPAMGKTSLSLNLLNNFCEQGKKCLFLTTRESERLLLKRLLIQKSEIGFHKITQEKINKTDIKKMETAKNEICNWDFKIKNYTSFGFKEIEEIIEKEKADYIFIDDIQLLVYDEDWILKELKNTALKQNIIIFLTSSLSRNLEHRTDKSPLLCDLKQTTVLEDISDVVMMIYREDYYNSESKNDAEIIIAKNTCGCSCTINLKFNPKCTKFDEKELIFNF
ncbi:DnaB-like helicase C-terminal domain-containing protein [bacterium]|nr:DnaB-like helicase C-terminal domain-containing protein [bacterium]